MNKPLLAWATAGVFLITMDLFGADPAYYRRKNTWQETMRASREALLEQLSKPSEAEAVSTAPRLGAWYTMGTFTAADSFSEAFIPEKEINLAKRYDALSWKRLSDADGVVHGLQMDGNTASYFYRKITAAAPVAIMSYYGSDDGLAVWLNGKNLISNKVPRGASPNQDRAKLDLKKGDNHLLIKIWNRSGGSGWYFSTSEKGGAREDPAQAMRNVLWDLVRRDFTDEHAAEQMRWEKEDAIWSGDWQKGDVAALGKRYAEAIRNAESTRSAAALLSTIKSPADLDRIRRPYYQDKQTQELLAEVADLNMKALRMAVEDLTENFPTTYPGTYLARLDQIDKTLADGDNDQLLRMAPELVAFRREALLANPLMDFDKLLVIRRPMSSRNVGLPQNWQGNCALTGGGAKGFDDDISVLSPVRRDGSLKPLFKPEAKTMVSDVDLHFDGQKIMFSSMDKANRSWQIFEIDANGSNLRQLTPDDAGDYDNFDSCYLPDGRIIFTSTCVFQGVPCVGGGNKVSNLFIMDANGKHMRRLTYDQDQSWYPTVMNSGRVMYTRWEYSDAAHYFSRIVMHMNPDGSNQVALYGSGSYWPNSTFYGRPVPGHPSKFAGIVSGHHGVPRQGELIIFDPAKGQHETSGVVQRIPGHGQVVEPRIADGLVNGSWPKFLHPWPLNEKYYLVSAKKKNDSKWKIYLVDVFDNMLLVHENPDGYALMEPVPFRSRPTPPVIADRIDLEKKTATMLLTDIYVGKGLEDVPRGTVRKLVIYEPHYAYYRMGGHVNIGIDGPWDVRRIWGTVPVHADGSANFEVPANTPLAFLPLDKNGKAVQLMRTWTVAMPGENVSCVGCHETQTDVVPNRLLMASASPPNRIEPWHGPTRGFSFKREVQPVLSKYCVSCHNGEPREAGQAIPDFRPSDKASGGFTKSYVALHPFVRRPGPESDMHVLTPMEYHADTSELVQMLRKGHGNVTLDADAWDRLLTWIDLNVPDHGTWTEHRNISGNIHERRTAIQKLYAGINEDPEDIPAGETANVEPVTPGPGPKRPAAQLTATGWPFTADEARKRQAAAAQALDGKQASMDLDLGEGVTLSLVLIPAGEFVMGDINGWSDEWPQTRLTIRKPFWIGKCEVSNAQFRRFDPAHNSRHIYVYAKDHGNAGIPVNGDRQPAVRVSWQRAMAFCKWLSDESGLEISLPTEAQWEYACRAGTDTATSYGTVDADFSKVANFADNRISGIRTVRKWIPRIDSINDGATVTTDIGRYQANAWGLHDMHGNACEWTRSTYQPYPYAMDNDEDDACASGRKVVRGGSFFDRPKRGRSSFRMDYEPWQAVYNVGFRVVCRAE